MFKRLVAALGLALLLTAPVHADQNTYDMPLTGPSTFGDFLNTYLNPALQAILTNNAGSSAPTAGGQPTTYQWWMDTSGSPKSLGLYDGSAWAPIGLLDTSAHTWTMKGSAAKFTGSSSGTVTISPQAAAGTPTLTLPNATGTFAVNASSPLVLSSTTGALTCPSCATTTSGGSITGTPPVAVSSGGAVSITGAAGQVLAGSGPAFTATPTLGVAGSTVGTLAFANATSGSITVSPPVGALGTVTVSLPAATDTLVGKATTDTLTNKTLDTAGTGNVLKINGTTVSAVTGSGSVVLATSPTLVTPVLGAASGTSLTLSGLTASSAVATDGSKNLVSVTNTGSGNNVLATSPTLVTPVLGAASGTSLSLSGLTASSAVATDGSKNLVSVTNTGSGNNVLATSPTLVTPILGVAAATTVNKVTITAPATGSTLTIADGKTLTANNSIALTGTDSTVMTFPTTTATIARTDAGQTFTGVQTMTSPALTTPAITGLATGTGVASAATASTLATRDVNANLSANNFLPGYATTATAAGTTVLTVSSPELQYFTGITIQTVTLPVTSTLVLGQSWTIVNNSSGVVTVNSSGANLVLAVAAGNTGIFTVVSTTGTTAASWSSTYISSGAGTGTVTSVTCGTNLTGGTITTTGTCNVSPTPSFGTAGSVVGTAAFANATSGTITLSPPTGALGTVTLTLPAATDTLVGKATTDTLTNKTINGASNTLTVRLGSDISGTLPATNGGTAQSTYSTGDTIYASAANTVSKRTVGSTGQSYVVVAGVPNWGSSNLSSGSAVSMSGTSVDFTSIPSWVTIVDCSVTGLSTSGTSQLLFRLGDSGGFEATGYLGAGWNVSTGVSTANDTTGVRFSSATWAATYLVQGSVHMTLIDPSTFTWAITGLMARSEGAGAFSAAFSKATSAQTDRVQFTMANGTDTFDGGTASCLYS